jgi:hypothetical protein
VENVRIEYVPLSSLVKWPRNPKDHDLEALGASYKRFGFVSPMIMDERTGRLVVGMGRLEQLEAMFATGDAPPARIQAKDGEWLVPVVRGVSFRSDEEAEAYLLADNRLTERGGWLDELLDEMIGDLDAGEGLEGTGFDEDDVGAMLVTVLEPDREAKGVRSRVQPGECILINIGDFTGIVKKQEELRDLPARLLERFGDTALGMVAFLRWVEGMLDESEV